MNRFYRSLLTLFFTALPLLAFGFGSEYDIVARPGGHSYHPSPEDWRDVNMYQLFTDRFYDGNTANNNSRTNTSGVSWYNAGNSSAENDRHLAQGGDWAGIKAKLPYLEEMGVTCIWISGVQLNEQGFDKRFTPYHAYHPANFYKVEPLFGTFVELKDLIDTAHSKGIYVILDVVVNHMADLFKHTDCNCNYEGYCESNCGALDWWDSRIQFAAPFSHPDNFHNHGNIGDNDWDTYPRYVKGSFLGTEDLKTEDPYVQGELRNIFRHLIDATDCDGFRVDAIKHMEYDFIKDWANDMRSHAGSLGKTNFILFGEYFSYDDGTQASYTRDEGYSFNSTLWFPMQLTMKNVFAYEQGTTQLRDRMNAMGQYGEGANNLVAFIDNHDVDRFALECGQNWEQKMRPALTFLYTCLPVPCLFYGTEHGFNQGGRRNGSPKLGLADFQRECMMDFGYQWGNADGDKFYASSMYNHIKTLNQLRDQYISLRRGSLNQRWSEGGKGLFAVSRQYGDEESLIAINTDYGNKSMTPAVDSPDGTEFTNVLNPSEKVTVSGGTLSISVDGKGSKVFVSGGGSSAVSTDCNIETLTIRYSPNGGPLASAVGTVQIGIINDGGVSTNYGSMTAEGDDWVFNHALSNAATEVEFWFYDQSPGPVYDNNDSANWSVGVVGCGLTDVDLVWIGNTSHFPTNGNWDTGEDLWVDIESYPKEAVIQGSVVYTVDGTTWNTTDLLANGETDNNDKWHANLGAHPGGTTLRYAVNVIGRNTNAWDNNSGSDYTNSVNAGPTTVTWVGGTYHWPIDGDIEPGSDLWINTEVEPAGAAVTGEVVYTSDGGSNWLTQAMSFNNVVNGKDWWNANLGTFAPEADVMYAVKIVDVDGTEHWDNNGGPNFSATINPAASSVRWLGNAVQANAPRPVVGLDFTTNKMIQVQMGSLSTQAIYTLLSSSNLQTWVPEATLTADEATEIMEMLPESENGEIRHYSVRVDWMPPSPVFNDKDTVISIETWPVGGATGANLVYSTDGGSNWNARIMTRTAAKGNNDVWTTSLGILPIGTVVQYAIEVIDGESGSQWDNNGGDNFNFTVLDPSITDFEAPVVSHSPQDAVTADPTLKVTLSATDNEDPSPVIYFTVDGSEPDVSDTLYSTPITVTNQGAGVDVSIKYFARDASGNESAVKSVEVIVGQTFTFGGNKPYSTNPSLGLRVANGSITIDGANTGEWSTNHLVAIDMANDDPRSLGSNWTMHEAPVDYTHLYAAWDDNNLYLAWQLVDVTDIIDPSNSGSGDKVSSNDGILQWIVLDTIPDAGSELDMWGKNEAEPYWTGSDKPDYQIYIASSLWQGYISRAVNGVFPVDDGQVNYFATADAGISMANGNSLVPGEIWGVGDADNRNDGGAPNREFRGEGHSRFDRDSFYEMSIPLSHLNITASQLETSGIGVMIGMGLDTIPHDEATVDNPGVEVWNSSFEWGDADTLTAPFARIGAGR